VCGNAWGALGAHHVRRSMLLSQLSVSGVGILETAIGMPRAAAVQVLGQPLRFESVAACDANAGCQRILVDKLAGGQV
jgi:hypothetical protein